MAFAHLHLHTEYSLLDGANRIGPLVSRLKELGFTHAAITDHGVMYGAVDFYNACRDAGITPVIGCEVYICRNRFEKSGAAREYSHMILLCENNTGYQNLIKLVSAGFTEGFYYKPRIDYELLKQHTEGLICLSACLSGDLPKMLLEGRYDDAKAYALQMQELFGKDHYYIELMDHGIPEEKTVLPRLVRVAQETGIPMVVTNDCHYLNREDSKAQEVLLCIQTGKTLQDESRMRMNTEELYVKSEAEMRAVFPNFPEAIENSQKIAQRCQVTFDFGHLHLPRYPIDDGETAEEMLRRLCGEGLKALYPDEWDDPASEPCKRLEYELSVISHMGYVDYFLIVWDFINYAKSHGIMVGPGRGSGAGSIVAYTLRITMLDPLKYSLLFERFLNPERVSMPDLDIDFCYERRQEVIDYVARKYGSDHVSQIITFGTMSARAVVRDVGRVLGYPYAEVDAVSKSIPFELNMTLARALEISPELKKNYQEDARVKRLIDTSRALEGLPRHASTHAAGVVITRNPVDTYVPLAKNDEAVVTQYTMTTLEELGLLKMDFLALRNLTVLDDAIQMVRTHTPDFDLRTIPDDDPQTFQMLSDGRTCGVFQMESAGMTGVCVGLKPKDIEDITAIIALYRPGPMDSIPRFIASKHDPASVRYKHPSLEPILSNTYGCIVYQEQVIEIFRRLAGYSLGQADMVRRAMSKKKLKDIQREREAFLHGDPERNIAGCAANGIPQEIAESIYDEITDFANYAFNKAHAVCYAIVAYQTAWFKCHYPREYMAALLTSVLDSQDKIAEYIAECRSLGIRLLPPDVNESGSDFTVAGQDIRFGLAALKGVGRGFTKSILTCRETDGPFVSFLDFCKRMLEQDMNKRMLESLIRAGAFDAMGLRRSQLLDAYEQLLDSLTRNKRKNLEGQFDLFSQTEDGSEPTVELVLRDLPEFSPQELMTMEKEVTGLYLSGHPMDAYRKLARNHGAIPIASVLEDFAQPDGPTRFQDGERINLAGVVSAAKTKTTKNNSLMAYVTLEDDTGSMELLAFSRVLEESGNYLQVNLPILVYGRISVRDEKAPQLMCDRVTPLNQVPDQPLHPGNPAERTGKLYLRFDNENDPRFQRIKNLLILFPGNQQAVLYLSDTGRRLGARCQLHPALLEELRELLGEENVVLKQ